MKKDAMYIGFAGVGVLCFVISGWLLIKGFRAVWPDPKPPKPAVAFVCPIYVTIKTVGPYISPGWSVPGRHDITTTQGGQYYWDMSRHNYAPLPGQKICITELD